MLKAFTLITNRQRMYLVAWALVLLVLGVSAGTAFIRLEQKNFQASQKSYSDTMSSAKTEQGNTQPELTPPPGHEQDVPKEVTVGMYLDRIPALSIKDSSWIADFYIWFKWKDDSITAHANTIFPFQVVNGEFVNKPVLLEQKVSQNGEHYALYRASARITKAFDTKRFPRDDHLLDIAIEDTGLQSYQLKFIADQANSNISSRVVVSGYQVYKADSIVKPHSYKTTRGDFDLPADYKATYSQFNYSIWIQRPTWGLHFRMFLTLFAAVLIPMIGFFTTPTHRLALVIGAFFAAVATTYVTSTIVPDTGIATMADVIDGIGIVTISIIIFQTVISQYFYEKQKDETFSDAFDYVTFVLLIGMFIWMNIAIPLAASLPAFAKIN